MRFFPRIIQIIPVPPLADALVFLVARRTWILA
jgi:hypothetical protein